MSRVGLVGRRSADKRKDAGSTQLDINSAPPPPPPTVGTTSVNPTQTRSTIHAVPFDQITITTLLYGDLNLSLSINESKFAAVQFTIRSQRFGVG